MPALPDLDAYSIPELEELQQRIDARLIVLRKQVAAELRERFAKEAEEAGLSIDDLFDSKGAARRGKRSSPRNGSQPKYQNPADPSQTWTGNGRQPRWVSEHLQGESGTLEDLAIQKAVRDASGSAA
jgi:DNA-binding protein H-NS